MNSLATLIEKNNTITKLNFKGNTKIAAAGWKALLMQK
jgi:hypothetical protein